GSGANQAVGRGDHPCNPGRAIAPGSRAPIVVPARTANHVIGVFQQGDMVSHFITGEGTDQAVRLGDGSRNPSRAAAPGRCSPEPVPARTANHVVAIPQPRDIAPHFIAWGRTDETVGWRNGTRAPGRAALPGSRSLGATPAGAADHVVAVGE